MGARGPAPKPTRLRVLHGDHPERVNRHEPRPAPLPVVMPGYLSPGAREKWAELVPHLVAMGIATAVDVDMLAVYCECYARWRRLVVMAASTPPAFKRSGEGEELVLAKNPLWSQVRDAEAALRVVAREFGFTPSARSGLRVQGSVAAAAERLLTDG